MIFFSFEPSDTLGCEHKNAELQMLGQKKNVYIISVNVWQRCAEQLRREKKAHPTHCDTSLMKICETNHCPRSYETASE